MSGADPLTISLLQILILVVPSAALALLLRATGAPGGARGAAICAGVFVGLLAGPGAFGAKWPRWHEEIFVGGVDVTREPMYLRARRHGISYLPQEPSVFRRLTVRENLMAILQGLRLTRAERQRRCDQLLDELGLASLASNRAYTLSGGERRRVEIARALTTNPSFLLLDEPFTGIDPIAIADIQELVGDLRTRGIGVLVTDHNVRETLRITDRAYIITAGKIFRSGPPQELESDPQVRKIYLGETFRLD